MMRKIKMMIELEYDADLHHGEDKSSIDWFGQSVLMNDTEDGGLILHSNEIGDEVGRVKTLVVYDWPTNKGE